jgi:hypothetical protein
MIWKLVPIAKFPAVRVQKLNEDGELFRPFLLTYL